MYSTYHKRRNDVLGSITTLCTGESWITQFQRSIRERWWLMLANPHGSRYDPPIAKQLAKKNIHLLLFPAGTTVLFQPLDVGMYAPYKQFLRKWMDNSQIVPVLEASRDAFSSAFTRKNTKEAWERTTLLSEDHSSVEEQLPVSNPFRREWQHRNSGDDLLCWGGYEVV